jgi:putative acetyltransferase
MGVIVEPGDPRHPEARALLEASHRLMQGLFPPEDHFFLSIDDLCADDILFFVAREYDTTLGTGALALRGEYGEVKSMFTAPFARGKGVAAMLLDRIELEARARDLGWLRLETGNVLHEAHRLYARKGFVACGPFGDYPDAASSVFMEKRLD